MTRGEVKWKRPDIKTCKKREMERESSIKDTDKQIENEIWELRINIVGWDNIKRIVIHKWKRRKRSWIANSGKDCEKRKSEKK